MQLNWIKFVFGIYTIGTAIASLVAVGSNYYKGELNINIAACLRDYPFLSDVMSPPNYIADQPLQECTTDKDCNHGTCKLNENVFGKSDNTTYCECDSRHITIDNDVCDYEMLSGLTALLLSIFLGSLGVEYCYLARGNGCYICLGILKGVTLGGCFIWSIVNIVLISTGNLSDGNGEPLTSI